MLKTFELLPTTFWIAILMFISGTFLALLKIRKGTGIPMLAVLFTVFAWYVGDVLYNDYPNNHYRLFTDDVLSTSWLQVTAFLLSFFIFVSLLNGRSRGQISMAYTLYKKGVAHPEFQSALTIFLKIAVVIWLIVILMAVSNIGLKVIHFIFPILGEKVYPFYRPRIGSGFSAVYSFAQYLHILIGGVFGIVAALSNKRRIRRIAILGCFLIWPYYFLDRTRNTILAVFVPGFISWVFLRVRGSNLKRVVYVLCAFLALSIWFSFVMEARQQGKQVVKLYSESNISSILHSDERHAGLNMYEELCWLNTFIINGSFEPNWGTRYFAEIVNPIPRGLWPNKPLIGIDYALARGVAYVSGAEAVSGTVSTGLIGQGVNNFGMYFGPIAAAFLMAIWVTVLAKIDTSRTSIYRVPLYFIGLSLTFNMGRDVTLLVLYPFIFGLIAIRLVERKQIRQSIRSYGTSNTNFRQ